MPAYRPFADVLAAHLEERPAPFTHDRLGRPLVGPCLIWTRAADRKGYGVVGNKDFGTTAVQRVHRASYALASGHPLDRVREIPEIDHLCRQTLCAAPVHLEPVTHAENIRRGDWRNGNRDKAECDNGHPFDEANTYWRPTGGRDCRTCKNLRQRSYYDSAKRAARYKASRRGGYWARGQPG
jgi:hypothetical protein